MKRDRLDRLCGEACLQSRPLLVRRDKLVELKWVKPPRPGASFGLINDWIDLSEEVNDTPTKLLIPFQPDRLGWVKQETLRLFRFDTEKEQFLKVNDALLHPEHPVVHATIDRAGLYGLIGLNTHPLILETIRLICELRPMARALPAEMRRSFRDRICEVILCAPEMEAFIDPRGKLVELVNGLGLKSPDELLAPLPRLVKPGETICDRCHGVDVMELPECIILGEPSAGSPCAPASWENVGPKHISGAMRQVVIDSTDHQRLYAVSANGGIWRLDNVDAYPRERWRPLTDDRVIDHRDTLRFRTMAIAPSDGRVLYAATSVKELLDDPIRVYSEVYRSGTAGRRWRRLSRGSLEVVHRLAVHPANPNLVFAATSTGLWRWSDERRIWAPLFSGDCLDMALDPDDSSIIYLGVRARGVFKSFTSGADWSAEPIIEYDPVSAGTTSDPSRHREAIKIALGKRNADGSEQTSTTRTVALRFGDEFCVSHTSGEGGAGAWQRFPLGSFSGGNENRSDTNPIRQHEWCNCLAVDPFDPRHILTGGVNLVVSNDGGESWLRVGHPHEDHHSIAFDEAEDRRQLVYLANDGGVFSSLDGGTTWPTMGLDHTNPSRRGLNLAQGLVTTEFVHSAVRGGRCVAAIDHTGFVLSENFESRWQFLFASPDRSDRHRHEHSFVFPCPASLDRYYVINMRQDEGLAPGLAQVDFTRTNGLVDAPRFNFLSTLPVFPYPSLPPASRAQTSYAPETGVYLNRLPGPFAVRFSAADDERLLLFGGQRRSGFTVRSLRLRTNGTDVFTEANEVPDQTEPFLAITFVPGDPDRAFAITERGALFERDFSSPGQFTPVGRWHLPAENEFVSRLVAVPGATLRLYALSQRALARFDDGSLDSEPSTMEWDKANETLLALAAHPTRQDTLFLGTTRGVYLSEDSGDTFNEYRLGMPRLPVTELTFDEGYLYAATFGRGLWRCRPCPWEIAP